MARDELLGRSLRGLGLTTLIMALCLFGPAGTWNFWQAWLFLAVFTGASLFITVYLYRYDPALLERRLHGGPGAEKEAKQKVILSFASLFFLAELVVPALDHRYGWYPLTPVAALVGEALIAIGFWIVFKVFQENTFAAAIVQKDTEQHVISTGPYALVRHPMYTGGLLLFFGIPLALGSGVGVWLFIPVLLVIVWRLQEEEKFLVKNLSGYEAYRHHTRYRLLPNIW